MKLRASYETEIYISETDYLVIKQTDALGDEGIIALTHDQVKIIAKELQKWAKNGDWWSVIVRDDSERD